MAKNNNLSYLPSHRRIKAHRFDYYLVIIETIKSHYLVITLSQSWESKYQSNNYLPDVEEQPRLKAIECLYLNYFL